ncbi:MAG: hypothetical protein ABIQ93_09900, partial [Saprospiraceae bacterium]
YALKIKGNIAAKGAPLRPVRGLKQFLNGKARKKSFCVRIFLKNPGRGYLCGLRATKQQIQRFRR